MEAAAIKQWIQHLPDRKRYIELITASLSVPVLLTVIYSNINNIKNDKTTNAQEPEQAQSAEVLPLSTGLTIEIKEPSPVPIQQAQKLAINTGDESVEPSPIVKECNKSVGPTEIIHPNENETVTSNPVCIDIITEKGDYCSVVWSYQINNAQWSEFTDKSICLYDLPPGNKQLEVRVRSIAGSEETTLRRNFSYQPPINPSPSVNPSASSSAMLTP